MRVINCFYDYDYDYDYDRLRSINAQDALILLRSGWLSSATFLISCPLNSHIGIALACWRTRYLWSHRCSHLIVVPLSYLFAHSIAVIGVFALSIASCGLQLNPRHTGGAVPLRFLVKTATTVSLVFHSFPDVFFFAVLLRNQGGTTAEPRRCHCGHGDSIELPLRFDGGATAIIGGIM